MSALALTRRQPDRSSSIWPAIGAVGAPVVAALMFYYRYTTVRGTSDVVLLIGFMVGMVELLYFERDVLDREIGHIESNLEGNESERDEAISSGS